MTVDRVADGVVVGLAYTLTVDDIVISEAGSDDPLEYLHGAHNIIPGLENALTGKQVGEKLSVTLPPEDAYGDYDEEDVEEIAREEMPDVEVLETGMLVEVEDEDGFSYMAVISEINDDVVVLDFNPPLAGKTLTYDVEVVSLRPATEDEIDHGHVHSGDHDH
jgi:FKBP-type peptidyl-prolyl cis-trans isomerase SlyD